MPTLRRLVDLLRVTENGQQNSARGKETAGYNGTAQHYKVYILLRNNPLSSEAIGIVIRYLAAASTTVEPDVKMNDGGNDPIYGELVLIATTNRQTDAIPFPGCKRHAKPRVVSSTFYTILNRIE
ncbi:hypothetical protein ALC53_08625 [Atta colombica]|uniref:Uncharacterized protein n=1 Tax=Atta colombica TaxID=520822 RepID=A0A151I2A0_9HYME|nr:hypothetical protein ALC53_08625 [Atta colombica]